MEREYFNTGYVLQGGWWCMIEGELTEIYLLLYFILVVTCVVRSRHGCVDGCSILTCIFFGVCSVCIGVCDSIFGF